MVSPTHESTAQFERLLAEVGGDNFQLQLFVTGMTQRSVDAVRTVRDVCEEHLAGRYHLEIIDVYACPERVKDAQIIVMPTLVRTLPAPVSRLIGGLSNKKRILEWFQLWVGEVTESRMPT